MSIRDVHVFEDILATFQKPATLASFSKESWTRLDDYKPISDGQGLKPQHSKYRVTIITPVKEIRAFEVIDGSELRDFESSNFAQTSIRVLLTAGVYNHEIFPYRDRLVVVRERVPLQEIGETHDTRQPIDVQRFKAVLLDEASELMEADASRNTNPSLGDQNLRIVRMQLINQVAEQLRCMTFGETFRNHPPFNIIRTKLTNYILGKVKVSVPRPPVGIDIVEPDVKAVRPITIIPPSTPVMHLPRYIQENEGGLYNSGVGCYYQDRHLWVYPLYDLTRIDKCTRPLTILSVPKTEMTSVERTYQIEGRHLFVLAMGDVKYQDPKLRQNLNQGNGRRYTKASSLFDGYDVQNNRGTFDRKKNSNEFLFEESRDGMQYTTIHGGGFTDNHANARTPLARQKGTYAQVLWENSDPYLVYPGMGVELLYIRNGKVIRVRGVVLSAEDQIVPVGTIAKVTRHKTNTALTLFLEQTERN